jgi:phosphohistidine swiveling domain-containing protein
VVDLLRPRIVARAHGGDDHAKGRTRTRPTPAGASDGADRARDAGPGRDGHARAADGHDHTTDNHDHGQDGHGRDLPSGHPDGEHRRGHHGSPPMPLVPLDARTRPDPVRVGAKAASLAWLAESGVRVPPAVAVPADVAARVAAGETLATELVSGALRRWLDPDGRYAVRSSADGEDGELRSFAGQLESRLDVPADGVLEAVRDVAAPDPERIQAYATRLGVPVPTRISVIVQAMAAVSAAGIAFSRNPLTGLDEVVVEAVAGRGDALAGDGATPDRWVWRWGAFTESPPEPRVAAGVIAEVVRETRRLARRYGRAVDLEWAHDGAATWWLQARPMTGLDGLRVYSNRIARDVLPGVIPPLTWSVNVPVVNAAWLELLEELVGPLGIAPGDLARSFGHRAYFDMTTIGRVFEAVGMPFDSLELLLGLPKGPEAPRFRPGPSAIRHVPRLARVARRTLARGRWARAELVALRAQTAPLAAVDPAGLDARALLARADAIAVLGRRAAYANIVVPLAMAAYDRALARQLEAAGVDPATVDPTDGRADRDAWSPTAALESLAGLAADLPVDAREALAGDRAAALRTHPDLAGLADALDAALARFGHLSESANDLSRPTWRERPDDVVDLMLAHRPRPARAAHTGLEDLLARIPGPRRPLVRLLWRRAGAFRVYRDAVGTAWLRVYSLFRPTFLALGERLVEDGILDHREDVVYLRLEELRSIAAGPGMGESVPRELVATRRQEVADAAELVVPELVYGDAFVALRPDEQAAVALTGIPTSRGSVRGTARVVRGTADFGRVQPGDVLVVPFSEVAWTPLFARASGVVAESGGILAHASVVAREYGIPCVVSVHGACAAIPDGATVVVDGMAGTVRVVDEAAGDG